MRHANLVEIYEIGEHAGRPYFAMELVDGGSLDTHLAGQPQPPGQAAGLLRTLARAVQHAHEQQIVHRDLKPANILLQGPAPLIPKISDFGLAKRLDSESTALTRDGVVIGTANYMAPEQAAGRVHEVGPAADIYSLGAILYELLSGRPPFHADSWDRIVQQVLHEDPARLPPEVPRDLETICLKCLEKEIVRRYASAGGLADDLERFLEGQPVVAVPASARQRLARLAGRDGYQIVGEIGQGPRSTVYHARYEPLQQPVALKVFHAGTCTREQWEERLWRSAQVWAAIAHPQIVPVHRTGWWDGAAYLALEFVPHGSLTAKLSGPPQPVRQALELVERLTEVVAYLHRQGVVHGNLKPSNILFAADGIPRLVDLRLSGGLFQCPLPEECEDLIGVGYLAPEFLRDAQAEPRPYTDIYGLGMILYELLTGRPAFDGGTRKEMLEQVRSRDPVPPSHFSAAVQAHVDWICLKCLRKNPWRRFTRTFDLLRQLRYSVADPEGRNVPDPRRFRGNPPESRDPS